MGEPAVWRACIYKQTCMFSPANAHTPQPPNHPTTNSKLQSVLEVEFDKLRERLTELAEAATDSDPLEGLAILTVMQQTLAPFVTATATATAAPSPVVSPTGGSRSSLLAGSGPQPPQLLPNAGRAAGAAGGEDSFLAAMLQSLTQSLAQRFAKFVAEQEQWVAHQAPDTKRAGVLAPFAKFPVFVDRLALVGGLVMCVKRVVGRRLYDS